MWKKFKKWLRTGKGNVALNDASSSQTSDLDTEALEASALSRPRGLQGRPSLEAQRHKCSSDNTASPAAAGAPTSARASAAAAPPAGHPQACTSSTSSSPCTKRLAACSTSTSNSCDSADAAEATTATTTATTATTSSSSTEGSAPSGAVETVAVAAAEGPAEGPPTAAATAVVEDEGSRASSAGGTKGPDPNHTPRDEDLQGCPPYATKAVWGLRYTMEDKWAAVPNLLQVPLAYTTRKSMDGAGVFSSAFAAASCGCIKRPKEKSMEDTPLRSAGAGIAETGAGSLSGEATDSLHYFAVFDGHGGAEAAKFCASRMHGVVLEEVSTVLKGEVAPADKALAPNSSGEWLQAALVKSFVTLDQQFLAVSQGTYVGTTAVVLLLGRTRIWVAHCGDSRCVLSRNGHARALTLDHKASRDDEVARVQAAGGHVWWDRVMGELAVSRAIGDHCLRPYVIPDPEVSILDRTSDDEVLVLASDGLWDVLSNQEAADMALHVLTAAESGGLSGVAAVKKAATALTKAALERGTRDNVTVLVVDLRRKPEGQH